ncbi:MAG: aminopeptidase [Eggerthellaceae bacterium]|nr:aminopeptidase [Eggerthellaceae bacterium]
MKRKNAWESYSEKERNRVFDFAEKYRLFISENKTERLAASTAIKLAQDAGYVSLDEARKRGKLAAGDKVYAHIFGKSVLLAHIGTKPLEDGLNILGAHIDSPRLDIKQNPLFEQEDLALLDTHYYGGIKKYQWVTLPLALHGVVAKKDGSLVQIHIGDNPEDPVFCVTDLLIHLAQEQMQKKANVVVEGEQLDVLVGGIPLAQNEDAEEKEAVKAGVLRILNDRYGIDEEDFLSAEIEVVPAGDARNLGFDSSMIIGYGHDDRSCAYPSLIAQLEAQDLTRTGICLLVDKEEIGSVGATGMTSRFFENTIAELMHLAGEDTNLGLRRCLARSNMLSSDVSAGFDPSYASAFEAKNAAFLGRGIVFNKFTGSRGKSGSNDANAEYMATIRHIMDEAGVYFQTAELGKVDLGGGGTIAYILAEYGMNVIDAGVPVLNMHSPWEILNKADLYEALKAYRAFLQYA